MPHLSENERPAVITDWALARDLLARPQGKAGYLTLGGERTLHWLVADLPLYGTALQISYPVDTAFMQQWPLPLYRGARVAVPDNETALRMYGNYIANERALFGVPAPAADPMENDDERRLVAARRTASLPKPRRTAGRKIGIVTRGEPTRPRLLPSVPPLRDGA